MKKKWKTIICIGLVCLLTLASVACAPVEKEADESPSSAVQINPLPEAISKDKSSARLYFGFMDQPLLVGESHSFDVPINESIENSIIRELIKGPLSTRNDLKAVINPQTSLVNVRSEGQFLFVTLSSDFLKPIDEKASSDSTYEKTRRMLAVYSIVNTLIEQGTYSRVQILIDDDGMGTGRPLTLSEAGLDGDGAVEALERNGEIILSGR
ncbi:MAG: GerMN domain-containing protein, partial [Christensenella sp.]|uniref:GerMN domain-containing protein n=1 Tax=Christensenella sp. TaxID=1935934 RepID=UPI002B2145F4